MSGGRTGPSWSRRSPRVADHAAARGVRLGVEPLNRYETSVVNTAEQGLEMIAGLPAEAVGLALDTYHLNIEERDPAAAIRLAGREGRLAHVQVCGTDRGTPGADHADWPALRDALADAGYAGPLCIESFTADNAAIATAASIWRPLADSQDAIRGGRAGVPEVVVGVGSSADGHGGGSGALENPRRRCPVSL